MKKGNLLACLYGGLVGVFGQLYGWRAWVCGTALFAAFLAIDWILFRWRMRRELQEKIRIALANWPDDLE